MWYVFLWFKICCMTVLCEAYYNPYSTNYINSFFYPRKSLQQGVILSKPTLNNLKQNFGNRYRYISYNLPYSKMYLHQSTRNPSLCPFDRTDIVSGPFFPNSSVSRFSQKNFKRYYPRQSCELRLNPHYDSFKLNKAPFPVEGPDAAIVYSPLISDSNYENEFNERKYPISEINIDYKKSETKGKNHLIDVQVKSNNKSLPVSVLYTIRNAFLETTTTEEIPRTNLPYKIVIQNLGSWVSKSPNKVMCKDIGSLSMLYKSNSIEGNSDFNVSCTGEMDFGQPDQSSTEDTYKIDINISGESSKEMNNDVFYTSETKRKTYTECSGPSEETEAENDETSVDTNENRKAPIMIDAETLMDNVEATCCCEENELSSTVSGKEGLADEDDRVPPLYDGTDISNLSWQNVRNGVRAPRLEENQVDRIRTLTGDERMKNLSTKIKKNNMNLNDVKFKNKEKTNKKKSTQRKELYHIGSSNIRGKYKGKDTTNKSQYHGNKSMRNACTKEVYDLYNAGTQANEETVKFTFENYLCECHRQHVGKTSPSVKQRKKKKIDCVKHGKQINSDHTNLNSYPLSNLIQLEQTDYDDLFDLRKPCVNLKSNDYSIGISKNDSTRAKRKTTYWADREPKRKRAYVSYEGYSCSPEEQKVYKEDLTNGHKNNDKRVAFKRNPKHNLEQNTLQTSLASKSYLQKCDSRRKKHLFKNLNETDIMHDKRAYYSFCGYGNHTCTRKHSSSNVNDIFIKLSTNKEIHYDNGNENKSTPIPGSRIRNSSKAKCEEENGMECVCFIETVVTELNNIVSHETDMTSLMNTLTTYSCSDYRPLNASYRLSSDLKPRLITRKHKELVADEKNGPKEVVPEVFQDLLLRNVPNSVIDYYVFPRASVEIPCFTNEDMQLSPNIEDSATYKWTHGNNKSITGGRLLEDIDHRGTLEIKEAMFIDSDNYSCTVLYVNPDNEKKIQNTFRHSVMVVSLPKLALHTLHRYKAKVKCDQETIEMFELYLPQQIEELICTCKNMSKKICNVEIHNPLCHGKISQAKKKNPKLIWNLSGRNVRQIIETSENPIEDHEMLMSLNYELDLSDISEIMDVNINKCTPFCALKIVLKLIEILSESFSEALSHSVSSTMGVSFIPFKADKDFKLFIACDGGLKLFDGFCVPCPVHTFSEEGSTECTPCPKYTYQPNIGSKDCERCPHPFKDGCSSLWSSPIVILIICVCILLVLLIVVLLKWIICLLVCSCYRKKKKSKKSTLKTDASRKNTIKRKHKGLQTPRHYVYDDSSDPPTPPTEDFSE